MIPFHSPIRRLRAFVTLVALAWIGLGTGTASGSSGGSPGAGPALATADRAGAGAGAVDSLAARLGRSGHLRAIVMDAGAALSRVFPLAYLAASTALPPGIHDSGWRAPDGDPIVLLSLVPFAQKQGARLGAYRIGRWPQERGGGSSSRYALPAGFIEVTPDNQDTRVSKRFRLRDFLTKDQASVWPKYVCLELALIDKLELVADELERRGRPAELSVMSGFRTPQYNEKGVGARGGRAGDSRHMYGDAADVFVDADRDGRMDDLDGDGRVTLADAHYLASLVESVEREHPDLVGGLSAYKATRAHGPFVHVDVRGRAARW
ncbi:MAG: hypothetical protein ACREOU_14795 [Candidatus Eiseniibacteriota bacterium]